MVDPVEPTLAEAVVGVHAVDLELEVGAAAPERDERARLRGRAAAHVEPSHRHARQDVADGLKVAAGRQCIEQLAIHHLATHRVLHVDDGRLTRDRHRFGDRADAQLRVDRSREVGLEDDAFALDGVNPANVKVTE